MVKQASKAKKLQNFGKAWKVGDKGICFYPVTFDEETQSPDLLVAGEWGYSVNDMNELGIKASFIPSNAEIDNDGVPVVPDITSQFSRIANAFIEGEKQRELDKLSSKQWPNEAALKAAIAKVEAQYDKQNLKAKKPVISRLKLLITTECVYVPMENDIPQWDKARLYAQSLSTDRIDKIRAIIKDQMFGVTKDSKWVEVQYNFVASDNEKSTAGKVAPAGITPEYSLFARFPDSEAQLKAALSQLPEDSDIIMHHNYSYRHVDESVLKRAFSSYAIMNSDTLGFLPEDTGDAVVKSAALIRDLEVLNSIPAGELHDRLEAKIAELDAVAPTAAPKPMPATEAPLNAAAPTVGELLKNPLLADADDATNADIADVDL